MEVHLTVQYSVHSTVVATFGYVCHKTPSMSDWSIHSVVICNLGNNIQDLVARLVRMQSMLISTCVIMHRFGIAQYIVHI